METNKPNRDIFEDEQFGFIFSSMQKGGLFTGAEGERVRRMRRALRPVIDEAWDYANKQREQLKMLEKLNSQSNEAQQTIQGLQEKLALTEETLTKSQETAEQLQADLSQAVYKHGRIQQQQVQQLKSLTRQLTRYEGVRRVINEVGCEIGYQFEAENLNFCTGLSISFDKGNPQEVQFRVTLSFEGKQKTHQAETRGMFVKPYYQGANVSVDAKFGNLASSGKKFAHGSVGRTLGLGPTRAKFGVIITEQSDGTIKTFSLEHRDKNPSTSVTGAITYNLEQGPTWPARSDQEMHAKPSLEEAEPRASRQEGEPSRQEGEPSRQEGGPSRQEGGPSRQEGGPQCQMVQQLAPTPPYWAMDIKNQTRSALVLMLASASIVLLIVWRFITKHKRRAEE